MAGACSRQRNEAVSAMLAEIHNLVPRLFGGKLAQASDFIQKTAAPSNGKPAGKINATQLAKFLGIPGA